MNLFLEMAITVGVAAFSVLFVFLTLTLIIKIIDKAVSISKNQNDRLK